MLLLIMGEAGRLLRRRLCVRCCPAFIISTACLLLVLPCCLCRCLRRMCCRLCHQLLCLCLCRRRRLDQLLPLPSSRGFRTRGRGSSAALRAVASPPFGSAAGAVVVVSDRPPSGPPTLPHAGSLPAVQPLGGASQRSGRRRGRSFSSSLSPHVRRRRRLEDSASAVAVGSSCSLLPVRASLLSGTSVVPALPDVESRRREISLDKHPVEEVPAIAIAANFLLLLFCLPFSFP